MPQMHGARRSQLLLLLGVTACTPSTPTWQQRLGALHLDAGGFTAACRDACAAELPQATVQVAGELRVTVQDGTTPRLWDLAGVWQTCQRAPGGRQRLVEQQLRQLGEVLRSGPVAPGDVLPLLLGKGELATLGAALPELRLPSIPFVGELVVVFIALDPAGLRILDLEDTQALGDVAALRRLALANLQRRQPRPVPQGKGPVYQLSLEGGISSSLLLLDDQWQLPPPLANLPLVVAVPARRALLVTGARVDWITAMQELSAQLGMGSRHPLSDQLLVRQGGKWQPIDRELLEFALANAPRDVPLDQWTARDIGNVQRPARRVADNMQLPPDVPVVVVQVTADETPEHTVRWRVDDEDVADEAALLQELRRRFADRTKWWSVSEQDKPVPPLVRVDPQGGATYADVARTVEAVKAAGFSGCEYGGSLTR